MRKDDFTAEAFAERQWSVRAGMAAAGIDLPLVFNPVSIQYLIGSRAKSYQEFQVLLFTLELVELDAAGMLDTAVEEMGEVFAGRDLGGGGTATTATIAIAERGVRNLLAHFGPREWAGGAAPPETRAMHMPDPGCYLVSEDGGLYEPLVHLGAEVSVGQAVGQIHFPERPSREPAVYYAKTTGLMIGRSHKVLVGPGDFLGLIAHDMP